MSIKRIRLFNLSFKISQPTMTPAKTKKFSIGEHLLPWIVRKIPMIISPDSEIAIFKDDKNIKPQLKKRKTRISLKPTFNANEATVMAMNSNGNNTIVRIDEPLFKKKNIEEIGIITKAFGQGKTFINTYVDKREGNNKNSNFL
ncbi:MAG TPA: hypothetical protein ENF81_00775 [Thermotogaceae bacterium]|nr:hypothetical protein [Thermotogaceae bacterium]